MSAAISPTENFSVKIVGQRGSMSGMGARVSSVSRQADASGVQWTATNQGFGNPPLTGPLDAKLGAAVLTAANTFLATKPTQTIDPAYNSYQNTVTIANGDVHGTYSLGSTAASALRDAVFAAANSVPY
ncbi:MAG: hypothetical protein H7123_01680 [Thermoleophilia bacterium]|nr:hypothetical protein [Thermoleophilia bacterium]